MIQLTEAQHETLDRMPRFRVVAQFTTGAVVAVYGQIHQTANVIGSDGEVYSFSRYLATLSQHSNVQAAAPLYANPYSSTN